MLPARGLYGHIRNNDLRSGALLAGFVVLVALFWFAWCLLYSAIFDGWLHAPRRPKPGQEITLAFLFAKAGARALAMWWLPIFGSIGWFGIAYAMHAALIRAATGARAITRLEAPRLYNLVENLAISRGLPVPRIEIMETEALNAYAAGLGPDDAVVAVTRGLLEKLEDDEFEAVLAHEMAHILNRDVRLMVVATVFAGGLTLVGSGISRMLKAASPSDGITWFPRGSSRSADAKGPAAAVLAAIAIAIVFLALTHLFALLTRFAISRAREFAADAGAVELTKNPDALIRALHKISGHDDMPDIDSNVRAMMISSRFDGLFATHPPIEDRVAALVEHAGGRIEPVKRKRRVVEPVTAAPGITETSRTSPWGRIGLPLPVSAPAPQPSPAGATPFAAEPGPAHSFGRRRSFPAGTRPPQPPRS
jgi:heat shock protein HtpX